MSKTKQELEEQINCYQLAIEQKEAEVKAFQDAIKKTKKQLALLEYGEDAVYIYCGEKETFYRPDAKGYTLYRSFAGVFTLEQGKKHLASVGKEKGLKLIPIKQI